MTFRSEELQGLKSWPPARADGQARKPTITLRFSHESSINGKPRILKPASENVMSAPILRAFYDSMLFSSVSRDETGTDLIANVDIAHEGRGSMGAAMLSGLTMTLIPVTASDRFTVTTEFTTGNGRRLGSVEVSEENKAWIQLFLLFAMPFRGALDLEGHTLLRDVGRETVLAAQRKGLL
jgi:hypothetical protein